MEASVAFLFEKGSCLGRMVKDLFIWGMDEYVYVKGRACPLKYLV